VRPGQDPHYSCSHDQIYFFQIPPHGRWRHLDAGRPRIAALIKHWASASGPDEPPSPKETCRRLVDLFLVSVLLDAGAGNAWVYREPESGMAFSRSEGLGVASVRMFERGMFSGREGVPHRVDGACFQKAPLIGLTCGLRQPRAWLG
jgi:hypothetical protein